MRLVEFERKGKLIYIMFREHALGASNTKNKSKEISNRTARKMACVQGFCAVTSLRLLLILLMLQSSRENQCMHLHGYKNRVHAGSEETGAHSLVILRGGRVEPESSYLTRHTVQDQCDGIVHASNAELQNSAREPHSIESIRLAFEEGDFAGAESALRQRLAESGSQDLKMMILLAQIKAGQVICVFIGHVVVVQS
jgi:hypothetical protein